MRNSLIKTVMIIFFFIGITLTSAYAGSITEKDSTKHKSSKHAKVDKCEDMSKCKDMDKSKDMSKCKDSASCKDMSKCKNKNMGKSMKMGKTMKMDSPKADNEKVINLKAIDKNKDGKVYECPMDWDVLSDKPGKDPKCGMELTEVTIEQAKKNLTDHGFKVK
jgi:hypothetical protein